MFPVWCFLPLSLYLHKRNESHGGFEILGSKGEVVNCTSHLIQVGIIHPLTPVGAPDDSILSHKSLGESLVFCWCQRFQPAFCGKSFGVYLHHLPGKYTKNKKTTESKIKIQTLSTHPIGSQPKKNTRNRDVPAGPSVML